MASPEGGSSLFSTPQRRKAAATTPLMDFSPHLSPIAQVSKPSPHRPSSLSLSNRKINSLPGIAEESSPTEHSAVLSSPLRKADFDEHELSMQSLSLLDESTMRQRHMGQSLHSISLLTEEDLSYSRHQPAKLSHAAKIEEIPERSYKLNLSTVFESNNNDDTDRTRRENRSLIEEIRQRYSSFATAAHEQGKEETPNRKPSKEFHSPYEMYASHQPVHNDKDVMDFLEASEYFDKAPPARLATERKKKEHIAFKEDDTAHRYSDEDTRRTHKSRSYSRSPRRSPSRSPANLPVGSFFALVLDKHQNPLLVPVVSHASDVEVDEDEQEDLDSHEERGRQQAKTPPSSSSRYNRPSPPHSRAEYYRRKFDESSRDSFHEIKRSKHDYDSLLEDEDHLLRSISYISRAPVASRYSHGAGHRTQPHHHHQHQSQPTNDVERERMMTDNFYMPIQQPMVLEHVRRSAVVFPSGALGSTFHTDTSKLYSVPTLDPIVRDGADAPVPFINDMTPTGSEPHHHMGYWKSRMLKRDLTSIMASPSMKKFS